MAWRVVKLVNERTGDVAVLRVRTEELPTPQLSRLTKAVSIVWSSAADRPLPSTEVRERQREFEALLDPLTADNGFSELVEVATARGEKVWLFYTCDDNRFRDEMHRRLRDHGPYPVAVVVHEDPDWEIWRNKWTELKRRNVI